MTFCGKGKSRLPILCLHSGKISILWGPRCTHERLPWGRGWKEGQCQGSQELVRGVVQSPASECPFRGVSSPMADPGAHLMA